MNRKFKLMNNIKEKRLSLGLTQSDLAAIVGSTQNTISSIETGQYSPSAYLSGLLCEALSCKWEDLFYYDWRRPHVFVPNHRDLSDREI